MRQIIHCPRCGFTTNHKGNLFKHFHKKKLCKPKFVKASRRQMTEEFDQYQERYLEHISGTRNMINIIANAFEKVSQRCFCWWYTVMTFIYVYN